MKLKPLLDYVVIRPIVREGMTTGGIHIPDTIKENCQRGEVVDVGPGRMIDGELVVPRVEKGDKVIHLNISPTNVIIEGESLLILPATAVIGLIEE